MPSNPDADALVAALVKAREERDEARRELAELVDFLRVASRRYHGKRVSVYASGFLDCAGGAINWIGKHQIGSPELERAQRLQEAEGEAYVPASPQQPGGQEPHRQVPPLLRDQAP